MSSRGAFSGQGRGGGGPGARGGGGSGLAGGHGQLYVARCMALTDAVTGPRSQFEQQFNGMSIKDKVAVDGTSLQMGKAVPPPRPDPMPSNEVDAEVFKDILEGLEALDAQAEFPLRQTFAKPDTSVYTNHFAIKLDQNMPLYEYNITGLPAKTNKRTARMLVQAAIDNLPVFETNQNKFATDYDRKLVAWVELPRQASIRVSSAECRAPMGIGFECIGSKRQ
jgi:eukaryotic translation initiation factor 2C